jgi:outer membrane lipoprotein carrier protein
MKLQNSSVYVLTTCVGLFAIFNANVAHASTQLEASAVVANTASVKQKLQNILAKTSNYSAEFKQEIIDNEGNLLQSASGLISLAKPNQMRWETQFPDETVLVADGKSVFNLDSAVEQLTIFEQQDIGQNNPLMLLVSDDEEQWKQVTVSQTSTQNQYAIVSVDPTSNIRSVLLTFSQDTLVSLESVDIQGQVNKLAFDSVKVNQAMNPNTFKVDVPDYFVIDDQRSPS